MKLLLSFQILLVQLSWLDVQGACPPMITRMQWNASLPLNKIPMRNNPVPNVVIHHSATRSCSSLSDCGALIKSFQNNHMNERGWDDIAYSFLIGGDGVLYEGRGWGVEVQGTQPPEWNYLGYTFCILGSFDEELPTSEQLDIVQQLIECAVEEGHTPEDYGLRGHRDVYSGTSCPGETLYQEIQSWPQYINASISH